MTTPNTSSVSNSVLFRKEENADIAEITEDIPAPAPTLETVDERPHTPGTKKSTPEL